MNEALINNLIKLANKFQENGINLILGGGLGLYLRYIAKEKHDELKLNYNPRSTNDMDIFFTADIITNKNEMETVKNILSELNYIVLDTAKYFQFKKIDEVSGNEIKIDLLSSPAEDLSKVDIKLPRIRPKGVKNIHAYLTNEARHIDIGLKSIDLASLYRLEQKLNVYILSDYNYIILKLHAFADRISDEKKDYGRYHVLDIFNTVLSMLEEDWKIAHKHRKAAENSEYITRCINIISDYFSAPDKMGIIRLKENENYEIRKNEYDEHIDIFISDIKELFKINQT